PSSLVGKWLGLTGALWVVAGSLALALCLLLTVGGHGATSLVVIEAAYMAGLELTVVTALAVLFSALSTPVLSALYTLGFYMVGQWSWDLRDFGRQIPNGLGTALQMVANLVPNLPIFNIRTLAAHAD